MGYYGNVCQAFAQDFSKYFDLRGNIKNMCLVIHIVSFYSYNMGIHRHYVNKKTHSSFFYIVTNFKYGYT